VIPGSEIDVILGCNQENNFYVCTCGIATLCTAIFYRKCYCNLTCSMYSSRILVLGALWMQGTVT